MTDHQLNKLGTTVVFVFSVFIFSFVLVARGSSLVDHNFRATNEATILKNEWILNEKVGIVLQEELNTSFFFVEDNPEGGIDPIRAFLERAESNIRELYHHLLYTPGCTKRDKSRLWGSTCQSDRKSQLVVDIGANRGYYSLLAASYGHDVITLEPQPHCSALLRACILLNGFQNNINLKPNFISTDNSSILKIKRRTGCTGTFPNDNDDGWAENFRKPLRNLTGADDLVSVESVRLDQIVTFGREISLMKIDVEGFETKVIESGKSLFEKKLVKNLLMEINLPMLRKQEGGWQKLKVQTFNTLKWLHSLGYQSKISVKGHWKSQEPMKLSEWKDLLDLSTFVTMDTWFYIPT